MERLNDYEEIFATVGDLHGTVYLDSYNANNIIFEAFSSDDNNDENLESGTKENNNGGEENGDED